MIKKVIFFFQQRDPDLEIFSQVLAMFVSNLIGLFFWIILRFPCSMLIVLAPGIIVAIVFKETNTKSIIKISFITATIIAIFYIGTIMLNRLPVFQVTWVALTIYFMFSSQKTRYIASFALLPCSLAFHMPPGALSVIDRVIESYLTAIFAFATVIIIKESLAQYKIKRLLLILIQETDTFFVKKQTEPHHSLFLFKSEERIKKLTLKSVYLIENYKYLFHKNILYTQHSSKLLNTIIKVSRAITIMNRFLPNTFVSETKVIQTNLKNIYSSILKGKPVHTEQVNIQEFDQHNSSFNNYFFIKNILDDFYEINNYKLK